MEYRATNSSNSLKVFQRQTKLFIFSVIFQKYPYFLEKPSLDVSFDAVTGNLRKYFIIVEK